MTRFWALGDYAEVAKRFVPIAERLVAACEIAVGDHVLDVAAGNGNVAVVAAGTGARVTATDFTPSLLELGRYRRGDLVVIVAGAPPGTVGSTNLIHVHRIGEDDV